MSFASMLQGLTAARVRFVVVGGVAAAAHGSAHVTNDLDVCYDSAPDNVARLATLLAEWEAYPRGVEQGLPFFMDERQFRTTPLMTLTTREGDLDVLDRVAGVGDYAKALEGSVEFEAFGVEFPALDLPALIRAKRAAGRPKDMAQLPELEALAALRRRSR
jgi:hypothetical protein